MRRVIAAACCLVVDHGKDGPAADPDLIAGEEYLRTGAGALPTAAEATFLRGRRQHDSPA